MGTKQRRLTGAQARREVMRYQGALHGGLNSDEHPAEIQSTQVADCVNIAPHGGRMIALQDSLDTFAQESGTVYRAGFLETTQTPNMDRETFGWWLFFETVAKFGVDTEMDGGSNYEIDLSDYFSESDMPSLRAFAWRDGVMIAGVDKMVYCHITEWQVVGVWVPLIYATQINYDKDTYSTDGSGNAYYLRAATPGGRPNGRYGILVSVCRFVGDVLVWESLPIEYTVGSAISRVVTSYGADGVDLLLDLDFDNITHSWLDAEVTHVRVYRTLDILPDVTTGEVVNSTDVHYHVFDVPVDLSVDASPSIVFSDYTLPDDDAILANRIYANNIHEPFTVDGPVDAAYGWMFVADKEKLRYCETGSYPEFAGYWFTGGPQQIDMAGSVTSIKASQGFAVVSTISSVRRLNLLSLEQRGILENGEYENIIIESPEVGYGTGVASDDEYSVQLIQGSRVIMRTSDSHMRMFDGAYLSGPIDTGRYEGLLRGISGTTFAVYSNEGYYQLFYNDLNGSSLLDAALRIDVTDQNFPACRVVYSDPCSNVIPPVAISKKYDVGIDSTNYTGILVFGTANVNVYSMTDYDATVKDLDWEVLFAQYRGQYDGYMCNHKETRFLTNGTYTAGEFQLMADTNGNNDIGTGSSYKQRLTLVGDQVDGGLAIAKNINNLPYVQPKLTGTDTLRFELSKIMLQMEVSDRRQQAPTVLQTSTDTVKLLSTLQAGVPAKASWNISGTGSYTTPASGSHEQIVNGTIPVSGLTINNTALGFIEARATSTSTYGQCITPVSGGTSYINFSGINPDFEGGDRVGATMWHKLIGSDGGGNTYQPLFCFGDELTVSMSGSGSSIIYNVQGGSFTKKTIDMSSSQPATGSWMCVMGEFYASGGSIAMTLTAYSQEQDTTFTTTFDTGLDDKWSPAQMLLLGGFSFGGTPAWCNSQTGMQVYDPRINWVNGASAYSLTDYISDWKVSAGQTYSPQARLEVI